MLHIITLLISPHQQPGVQAAWSAACKSTVCTGGAEGLRHTPTQVAAQEACQQQLPDDSSPAGITGSALSSANCVRSGLGPRRQKKRHLGAAPGGTVALCSGCCCSMVCRQSGSTTHLGTSTPSGVAPTCKHCRANQHAARHACQLVRQQPYTN